MNRLTRQFLLGPAMVSVAIFLTALGLIISQSLQWTEIPRHALKIILVGGTGNCDTKQYPNSCCVYSQFSSCKSQIGTNCVNGVQINGSCTTTATINGNTFQVPFCQPVEGKTCASAVLTIHTDLCVLNGQKNPDGTCQYTYTAIGQNSPTTNVCNCNPTFNTCNTQPAAPLCPTS